MKVVLLFGEAHGKTMDISDIIVAQSQPLLVPWDAAPRFSEVVDRAFGKIQAHNYALMDVVSDDRNGEDCALYAHHPNCRCHDDPEYQRAQRDKERTEKNRQATRERSGNGEFYDRYQAGRAAAREFQYMPGFGPQAPDLMGAIGFQVSGTAANPHYEANGNPRKMTYAEEVQAIRNRYNE